MRLDSIKNILFDLDGTLTDPLEGMTKCFHYAFERLSVPCPTEAELQLHIGPPLRSTFSQILKTTDEAMVERAVGFYRERFSTEGMFENEVYEGVPEMLAALQSSSKRLFVATSKLQAFTNIILRHFKLSAYFDGVYGSAPNGQFDNKVDLLRHLLASESLAAEETLMVGDRKYDITGAKENNCFAAGVTYGYGSMEELSEAGADYLCHSPSDVAALFSEN
ncbi:MAG: phosphoglycolate phosphatase [Acidobacteriota bacterium]|jgi:phosphoglycolate phosphatase|nr:phosphoglycolate phosphatase [Acidobacteriota bacterium]